MLQHLLDISQIVDTILKEGNQMRLQLFCLQTLSGLQCREGGLEQSTVVSLSRVDRTVVQEA